MHFPPISPGPVLYKELFTFILHISASGQVPTNSPLEDFIIFGEKKKECKQFLSKQRIRLAPTSLICTLECLGLISHEATKQPPPGCADPSRSPPPPRKDPSRTPWGTGSHRVLFLTFGFLSHWPKLPPHK